MVRRSFAAIMGKFNLLTFLLHQLRKSDNGSSMQHPAPLSTPAVAAIHNERILNH